MASLSQFISMGKEIPMNARSSLLFSVALLSATSCSGGANHERMVSIMPNCERQSANEALAIHQGSMLTEYSLASPQHPVEIRLWLELDVDGQITRSKPIISQSADARDAATCIFSGVTGNVLSPGERLASVVDWNGAYLYLNAPQGVRIVGTGVAEFEGIFASGYPGAPVSIEKQIATCTYPIRVSTGAVTSTTDPKTGGPDTMTVRLMASVSDVETQN